MNQGSGQTGRCGRCSRIRFIRRLFVDAIVVLAFTGRALETCARMPQTGGSRLCHINGLHNTLYEGHICCDLLPATCSPVCSHHSFSLTLRVSTECSTVARFMRHAVKSSKKQQKTNKKLVKQLLELNPQLPSSSSSSLPIVVCFWLFGAVPTYKFLCF